LSIVSFIELSNSRFCTFVTKNNSQFVNVWGNIDVLMDENREIVFVLFLELYLSDLI
jgi:Holliday junction resolvase-like predicted endonuclease